MFKSRNLLFFVVVVLFFIHGVRAQADCILGVGITNDNTLIDVFQLNTAQQGHLIRYGEQARTTKDMLEKKLNDLKENHPQSTVGELTKLASEFTVLMDSMTAVQAAADKNLLLLFNEKQYNRYRNLCEEAYKTPIVVIPVVHRDSL